MKSSRIVLLVFGLLLLGIGIGGLVSYEQHYPTDDDVVYTRASSHYSALKRKGSIQPRNFRPSQLLPEEKELFLTLHNQLRDKNNLNRLEWDDRLADSAQAYADKLFEEDCAIYHPKTPADDEKYLHTGLDGQNLSQFVYSGPNKDKEVGSITKAVRLWTDECKLYDPVNPTANGVGHFTQMMWKKTKQVGCAYRKLKRKDKQASIYVCHYHKSGNWLTKDKGFDYFRDNVEQSPVCIT